jgi:hypothetical protein
VPAGTVSYARYDHYSTGRTIEQALGIAPLTGNDMYATPLNEAFTGVDAAPAPSSATPDARTVAAGQPLTVAYQTTANTSNSEDWLGLYPVGVAPGAQGSSAWEWAAGGSGTATFPASALPAAGTYALWYLYDDGYNVLAGPGDVTIQ